MSKLDLALDPITHDLVYTNHDLNLVLNIDKVAQTIKQRLLFFQNDFFTNTAAGIDYFNDIFVKNPNVDDIESIFKAHILETEDVNELLTFDSSFDNANRSYSLSFSVDTTFGILESTESIFIGVLT